MVKKKKAKTGRAAVDWSAAGKKSWATRRNISAWAKAHAAEAASKDAFKTQFEQRGWRVAFFEGKTSSPRTGIIDAVAFRLGRKNADQLELRLVQLKGGRAGVSAEEVRRLDEAVKGAAVRGLIVEFDGKTLHIIAKLQDVDAW